MKEKMTLGASVLAAITASLCCIGPIVATVLGISSFGAAAFFEAWRPYFLAVTFTLLATSFYFTYRTRETVCADGPCPVSLVPRWNKWLLWLATGMVILFAAFPSYSGALIAVLDRGSHHLDEAATAATAPRLTKARLTITGMTCGGCEMGVESALTEIPGVTSVKASYEKGEAIIEFDSARVTNKQLMEAVEKIGYKVTAVKIIADSQPQATSFNRAEPGREPLAIADDQTAAPTVFERNVVFQTDRVKPVMADLARVDQLKPLFRRDSGNVRLIALLSPT
jgi:copper chaperone CopZ